MLATAFDHLRENEKTAWGFLAKNARLRKLWLDSFLFSQLWVFGCFMLTVTVALGINFCCSTSIDISLYYICSLLYYWEDTIAQIMYLYCSYTTCRYHFCTPWRCNAKHLNDWCGCFYLNIMDEYFCTCTDVFRQCRCFNFDDYFWCWSGWIFLYCYRFV